MPGRQAIPQTRRSTYRPLNQMNGDFLLQLKRPLCSEFGPEIRGTNKGKIATCKYQVKQWHKDKDYIVRKVSREEDVLYDTFLQMHKEKKRLCREAYKKQQERHRLSPLYSKEESWNKLNNVLIQSSDDLPEDTKILNECVRQDILNIKEKNHKVDNDDDDKKSKVVMVTKDSFKGHKQSERKSNMKVNKNMTSPVRVTNTSTETLNCQCEDSSKNKRGQGKQHHYEQSMPAISESELFENLTLKCDSKNTDLTSKSANYMSNGTAQTGYNVYSPILVNFQSLHDNSLKYQSHSLEEFRSSEANIDEEDNKSVEVPPHISLVFLNKKQAKQRHLQRKRILDNEAFTMYTKDESGNVIADIASFTKRKFNPPTTKESYFRKKLLAAQKDARDAQEDKIAQFFDKLDDDKESDLEYKRFRAQRIPTPEKTTRELDGLGVGLGQIAAVFNKRHNSIPKAIDPHSIEAMQYCEYLRPYEISSKAADDNREKKSP